VVLTFTESVVAGTGNIVLTPSGGNGPQTPVNVPVTDAQVTLARSGVTCDLTLTLTLTLTLR